jgi:hypothetical protein
MSKLCKETGFLNTEGKEVVQEFSKTIDKLLASPVVNEMSSAEIRTFGSNLAAILADKLSFFLQEKIILNQNTTVCRMMNLKGTCKTSMARIFYLLLWNLRKWQDISFFFKRKSEKFWVSLLNM